MAERIPPLEPPKKNHTESDFDDPGYGTISHDGKDGERYMHAPRALANESAERVMDERSILNDPTTPDAVRERILKDYPELAEQPGDVVPEGRSARPEVKDKRQPMSADSVMRAQEVAERRAGWRNTYERNRAAHEEQMTVGEAKKKLPELINRYASMIGVPPKLARREAARTAAEQPEAPTFADLMEQDEDSVIPTAETLAEAAPGMFEGYAAHLTGRSAELSERGEDLLGARLKGAGASFGVMYDAVKNIVTHPKETAKKIGGGLKGYWNDLGKLVENTGWAMQNVGEVARRTKEGKKNLKERWTAYQKKLSEENLSRGEYLKRLWGDASDKLVTKYTELPTRYKVAMTGGLMAGGVFATGGSLAAFSGYMAATLAQRGVAAASMGRTVATRIEKEIAADENHKLAKMSESEKRAYFNSLAWTYFISTSAATTVAEGAGWYELHHGTAHAAAVPPSGHGASPLGNGEATPAELRMTDAGNAPFHAPHGPESIEPHIGAQPEFDPSKLDMHASQISTEHAPDSAGAGTAAHAAGSEGATGAQDLSVTAVHGMGYEKMLDALHAKLQGVDVSHMSQEVQQLAHAKPEDLPGLVHRLATDDKFFDMHEGSRIVHEQATLSVQDGQLHFGAAPHEGHVVFDHKIPQPHGAPAPEAPHSAIPTPAPRPEHFPHGSPESAALNTNPAMTHVPNPAYEAWQAQYGHGATDSAPHAGAGTPAPEHLNGAEHISEVGAQKLAHPEHFEVGKYLTIDTANAHRYVTAGHENVVFGGTNAEKEALAFDWVSKHHDAVVYFEKVTYGWFRPHPHLMRVSWTDVQGQEITPVGPGAPIHVSQPNIEEIVPTPGHDILAPGKNDLVQELPDLAK